MSGWKQPSGRSSGVVALRMKAWLRDTFDEKKKIGNFDFTIREMMDDLEMDYDNHYDRGKVRNFIQSERKTFYEILSEMHSSGSYDDYKEAGMGDKEVFDKLVYSAVSRNIFPVFAKERGSDERGYAEYSYEFMKYDDFVEIIKSSIKRTFTEADNRQKLVSGVKDLLPNISDNLPQLPIKNEQGMLLKENTLEACPFCDKKFRGNDPAAMLNDHIRKKHAPEREKPPELDSFDCPLCGTKARPNLYRKLEGHVVKTYGEHGNYKCNECNAFLEENEIIKKD